MAGDWIKMRSNLWDDPRVGNLGDLTNCKEATIIGALYWLWATADQHTSTGLMPGLSLKQIDRKTGVKGFGQALCDIGWLEDSPEGVIIFHFEEHNGESAKKRCQTAKRVAKHKSGNAEVTPESEKGNADSVSPALPREREEKEKDKTLAAAIARTWWPTDRTFQDLKMIHAYSPEWVEQQIPSFVSYWLDRNESRTSFDALFIQHCQHLAKPRSVS